MPPPIALGLFTVFVLWLFRRELQLSAGVSHALWIPWAWITIIGSRFPSVWLAGTEATSADAYLEGSSLDRNVFLGLIVLGLAVLVKRQVPWGEFLRKNIFIVLFFTYAAFSLLWSDFPIVAFKRWHKVLGHAIMALVVLTDRQPGQAIEALFRRCVYVLIPFSVLLLKYYPHMSRGFDTWTGAAVNTGITMDKNALGNVSMIAGLFLVTVLFMRSRREGAGTLDRSADFVLASMVGWLLYMAHSATSLACFLLGSAVIVATQARPVARNLSVILVVTALTAGVLEVSFDVREKAIRALGRDPTLTGRTELWDTLQTIPVNPVVGVGFESFWLGPRVEDLWKKYWWKPNQAHNGYYEMYLNLGYLGVSLQLGMLLAAYLTARRKMLAGMQAPGDGRDLAMARFATGYVIALVVYNFTEATFKALHPGFFVFFLVAIQYPLSQDSVVAAEHPIRESEIGARPRWAPLVPAPAPPGSGTTLPRWNRVEPSQRQGLQGPHSFRVR